MRILLSSIRRWRAIAKNVSYKTWKPLIANRPVAVHFLKRVAISQGKDRLVYNIVVGRGEHPRGPARANQRPRTDRDR